MNTTLKRLGEIFDALLEVRKITAKVFCGFGSSSHQTYMATICPILNSKNEKNIENLLYRQKQILIKSFEAVNKQSELIQAQLAAMKGLETTAKEVRTESLMHLPGVTKTYREIDFMLRGRRIRSGTRVSTQ